VEVFSEAEFSLELRIISLRVRVRRQRAAASAEERKKKFYYKNRKSFTSHVSAKKISLLQLCCVFR